MPLFRKNFLKLTAGSALLPTFSTSPASATPAPPPTRAAGPQLHRDFLVNINQVRTWIE